MRSNRFINLFCYFTVCNIIITITKPKFLNVKNETFLEFKCLDRIVDKWNVRLPEGEMLF